MLNISPGKPHSWHLCQGQCCLSFFIKRNINHCPTRIKSNCYKTFIRPILEYASPIWAPHLQTDISALEKAQRTVTRCAMNNYSWRSSATTVLNSLDWPTLKSRHLYSKLVMFYKIINGHIEVPSLSLIPIHTSTRGHSQLFRPQYASHNT